MEGSAYTSFWYLKLSCSSFWRRMFYSMSREAPSSSPFPTSPQLCAESRGGRTGGKGSRQRKRPHRFFWDGYSICSTYWEIDPEVGNSALSRRLTVVMIDDLVACCPFMREQNYHGRTWRYKNIYSKISGYQNQLTSYLGRMG